MSRFSLREECFKIWLKCGRIWLEVSEATLACFSAGRVPPSSPQSQPGYIMDTNYCRNSSNKHSQGNLEIFFSRVSVSVCQIKTGVSYGMVLAKSRVRVQICLNITGHWADKNNNLNLNFTLDTFNPSLIIRIRYQTDMYQVWPCEEKADPGMRDVYWYV